MHILIIEDDPEILSQLSSVLKNEYYTVSTATDGQVGIDKIWDDSYDLIILDIMLPKISGLEVLREMREANIITPVLMLTAKGDIDDKITGLNLGADDYLPKPFAFAELLARIRALLRRGKTNSPVLVAGHVQLDTNKRIVSSGNLTINLTSKEFSLLEMLLYNKGRAVSRPTLAEHVWGEDYDPFSMSNFIDVHIKNLRKKLSTEDNQLAITTVRGFGYKIEDERK